MVKDNGKKIESVNKKNFKPLIAGVVVVALLGSLIFGGISLFKNKEDKIPVDNTSEQVKLPMNGAEGDQFPNILEPGKEDSPLFIHTVDKPLAVEEFLKLEPQFKVNSAGLFSINNSMATTGDIMEIDPYMAQYNQENLEIFAASKDNIEFNLQTANNLLNSLFDTKNNHTEKSKNIIGTWYNPIIPEEKTDKIKNVQFSNNSVFLDSMVILTGEKSPTGKTLIVSTYTISGKLSYEEYENIDFIYSFSLITTGENTVENIGEETFYMISSDGSYVQF